MAPSPVARVGAAYRKIAEAGRLVAVKDNIDVGGGRTAVGLMAGGRR